METIEAAVSVERSALLRAGLGRTRLRKKPLAEQLHEGGSSAWARYRDKAVGRASVFSLFWYELAGILFGNLHGAVGYGLRSAAYGCLFRRMGRGVILGRGLTLRHPGAITLGNRVAIDDYAMLDASGAGEEGVILGEEVMVSRNCVIQAKGGSVRIGDRCDIGCNTVITGAMGIQLGRAVLIAANCYLGGARYVAEQPDLPIMDQGTYSRGPVVIEDGVWLGAGATVLDGVRIGRGCIVGAGAVVTKELPAFAVAAGVPARVVRIREAIDGLGCGTASEG
jgi:acetyltransferase-like isoleucine patch superfamily enzyme